MIKPAIGFVFCVAILTACNNDNKDDKKKEEGASQVFTGSFKQVSPPYTISDTGLAKNKDTVSLPSASVFSLIPDSINRTYFGKGARVKYTALVKMVQKEKESYYLIKATAGDKKAAFLLVYDSRNNFAASYPFLLPDENPATSQASSIDKSFVITKAITQRAGSDIVGEGKEVVAYDAASKSFSLIMQDALNDAPAELVNPIDTFPKSNRLAGDYYIGKKNLVAVRDGRRANQLLVYIHTENESGDCKGSLKGEFLLTSATAAAYRVGGDPCVLALNFNGNSVSIKEETGCGNHRDVDCPLSGTFTRKKVIVPKQTPKKTKAK